MSNAVRILPHYTFEDYKRWAGKWEIIYGLAYDMSPTPAPKHQKIASHLDRLFGNALDTVSCKCTIYQPLDLKISEETILNPDLLIVCKPIEKLYLDFPPELVVEILSPSTRLKDLHSKFDIYENFGIKYYVIVDPDDQSIKVFFLSESGKYEELKTYPYTFSFPDTCEISVELKKIWE